MAEPTSTGGGGGGAKSELTTQMEDVLQLLNQRMEGQVSTVQVESAVSDLLSAMGARKSESAAATATATAKTKETTKKEAVTAVTRQNKEQPPTSSIQGDMGNYDDSSDDDDEVEEKDGASSSSLKQPQKKKRRIGDSSNDKNSKSGKQTNNSPNEKDPKSFPGFANEGEYRDAVSLIPMGKEAAKMMTTFGDGAHPLPDSLELALMGTRKALQVSIMDARKVRRRLQKDYRDAQSIIMKYNPNKYKMNDKSNPTVAAATAWVAEQQQADPTITKHNDTSPTAIPSKSSGNSDGNSGDESAKNETTTLVTPSKNQKPNTAAAVPPPTANSIDPRLIYRALAEGTDKLSYSHKCGFHMEELSHLYPEEMMAYHRWNEMHEEYSESKADDGAENDNSGNKNNKNPNSTTNNNDEAKETYGGHLRERAANFDYRTDQMKNDWYVEYAKVRQGSFLPSSRRVKRTKTEIEWDRLRRIKKGRHAAGEWENISGRAVRFLHWLGFDPPNLFPPDEETTQALAFLAYDRFGRIVEKAIFLRNETDERALSLWELHPGELLSVRDIERALEDPDIKPATVYGTEDSKASSSIQLYFGPGWEDRLELEMEE